MNGDRSTSTTAPPRHPAEGISPISEIELCFARAQLGDARVGLGAGTGVTIKGHPIRDAILPHTRRK